MILGVIPARYSSSRLMGKPLAMIGNKPMIWHTYTQASKSKLLDDILIAVDDERVYEVVKSFGARVKMTPSYLPSGSDRIAYAVKNLKTPDIIVNIQGDEPFISGAMIDEAIEPLLFDKSVEISTLAKRISTVEELKSPSIPKVVFDYNSYALYFSRSPIPYVRDVRTNLEKVRSAEIYKHIGLYVYRKEALLKFTSMEQTDLEKTEKLEQLRMLENGMKIKVVVTEHDSFSVDTPEDLERARIIYDKLSRK
ncbi:MAG: 3-deoxy-manno-octulosonate cytidylyltransferase [Ignavibacteria bacterium]|nr:MAG: 3-deoxy-manno-octulosonate cytidylyltransferase [Ignavibacteria bacterium]